MHETRNFVLVVSLSACVIWAIVAWFLLKPDAAFIGLQRVVSLVLIAGLGLWLFHALVFEDKLPDYLKAKIGPIYYEADGLSFKPTIRVNGDQAELCIFYQNRYENPVEAIVHLRPKGECFLIRNEVMDINFAFRVGGGDFGMIHQPIAVPRNLQGEVISMYVAAATYYPRSHGACWRRKPGIPCGTLPADWSGSAFKSGVHEGSAEMELANPAVLHLAMPTSVAEEMPPEVPWRQEQIEAGEKVAAA
jgi:hypothetical protein